MTLFKGFSTGALGILCLASMASANPTGGTYDSTQITITTPAAGHTVIQQTSDRAIINWQNFNIATGEHTQFIQPSASSVTLNRVTGNTASQIQGRLSANGNIILVNTNGITFGSGARVDVNGLTATTADISNTDFNNSDYRFTTPGKTTATISNMGQLTGNSIALVAPNVTNGGLITANLGKVQLASGNTWVMDLGGLVKLAVDDKVAGQLIQSGTITADGGTIALTANTASSFVNDAIRASGTLRARSVGINQRGNIVIGNPEAGKVSLNGNIDASGSDLTFASNITIGSGLTPVITLGSGNATFGGTVNGVTGGALESLTINGTQGSSVVFNRAVGTSASLGNISITADQIDITNDFLGTGTLTLQPGDDSTSVGIGDNATGIFNLTSNELQRLIDGFTSIVLGRENSTTTTDLQTATWNDPVTFRGNLNVNGDQFGVGNASITFDGPTTFGGGNVFTSGRTITLDAPATIAEGKSLTLDSGNGAITINAGLDGTADGTLEHLIINAGTGTLTTTASLGSAAPLGDVTITANTLNLGAALKGLGNLILQPFTTNRTIGLGTGATGAFQLDSTELARLAAPWQNIIIGRTDGTGAIDLRTYTWQNNLTLRGSTAALTVNGAQNFGNNDFTVSTDSLNLRAMLTGTGTLTLQPGQASTTSGIGSNMAGTFNLDDTELANLGSNWAAINFGRTDSTAATNLGPRTWADPVTFRSNTGLLTTFGDLTGTSNASFTFDTPTLLGHHITTAQQNIIFNGPTTLAQSVTLNSNDGDIVFANTLDGNFRNLTLNAGSGNITFHNQVIALGTGIGDALKVTATSLLQVLASFTANGSLNINAPSFWADDITLAGGAAFNGPTTFDGLNLSGYGDFIFNSPTTLSGGPFNLNSHGGNIAFNSTITGGQDFNLNLGGGDLVLADTADLGQTTFASLGNVTATDVNATNFHAFATGDITFNHLTTKDDFSLIANNIAGSFKGKKGELLAANNITADVDVAALTIAGQRAALSGKVGKSPQRQRMANRVSKTITPGLDTDYTLNDFIIGAPATAEETDILNHTLRTTPTLAQVTTNLDALALLAEPAAGPEATEHPFTITKTKHGLKITRRVKQRVNPATPLQP